MQLVAWGKVNWIDSMAISKWLNILALHLLEIQKHSSFPTSFLIRRCPLSFTLTLWIWFLPLAHWPAMNSDERAEPDSFCFTRWGEREDSPQCNTVFLSLFRSIAQEKGTFISVPARAAHEQREHVLQVPTGHGYRLRTGSLLLAGICSFSLWFWCMNKVSTGVACNDCLVLKPIAKPRFSIPL